MSEQRQIWKVYFPQCCLDSPTGVCLGWTCAEKRLVCVLAVAQASVRDISDHLSRNSWMDPNDTKLEILGVWENDGSFISNREESISEMLNRPLKSTLMLRLCRHGTTSDDVPDCELQVGQFGNQDDLVSTPMANVMFILYEQRQLCAARTEQWSRYRCQSNKQTQSSHCTSEALPTDIEQICRAVQGSYSSLSALKLAGDLKMSCDVLSEKGRNLTRSFGHLIWGLMCMQLKPLLASLNVLLDNRIFHSRPAQWLVRFPATGCQLIQRHHTLQRLIQTDECELKQSNAEWKQKHDMHQDTDIKQRRRNILCSTAVDVCLGIALMLWLQHNNIPVAMAEWIMTWANTTGEQLQQLLQWLMGNPAGLKLNSALAHFLGHFFLYHVYLWIGYLTVIGPFLSMLIWCMALSGCLGLSVLLSVASDMLSILTFHIYCFYVYAAKIYSMQMSGLLSLSRLFRGKKWNVLRCRVDSCAYDKDQLFIGTLLFTMLLFLLPTTALFYTVFTLLRLVVLIIQSLLTRLVHLLNTLPVFSLILWATKSESLTDGVEFHVKEQLNGRPPYLIMHVQPMSLSRVIQIGLASFSDTNADRSLETQPKTILDLGKSLLSGRLIFPWGGDRMD